MPSSAQIVDGQIVADTTPTYEKRKPGDSLDKQAFLQLLVAQMQYQDPLEPMDNTEYVSQLAQFSALEAMQSVEQTLTNQNAFNLVGKHVIMSVGSSDGSANIEIAGKVDFVQIVNGKAQLSIEDKTYSIDDLEYVVGDDYLASILTNK
ncbi:MAG: hypothetical protein K2M60_04710 [Lachnospiraceae bacterium]|nr:hypothetical protein [Lachnospiraceae bacterium]MDE6253713.1 hypothetical protein [Lachnospiraceae bacterium]